MVEMLEQKMETIRISFQKANDLNRKNANPFIKMASHANNEIRKELATSNLMYLHICVQQRSLPPIILRSEGPVY
jgi:hypothetical protein